MRSICVLYVSLAQGPASTPPSQLRLQLEKSSRIKLGTGGEDGTDEDPEEENVETTVLQKNGSEKASTKCEISNAEREK
ncbi:MAG: hypothetical protein L6R35_005792 [Caloplaca aegaea]|nr:MAG: hypothetical protein L6R35_005792 [Caloplaca aegaea]